MKLKDFNKLEKKINKHNFNESYKGINNVSKVMSYFGNIASIFLAYFFLSDILLSAMSDNKIIVFFSTIIILIGLELLKRDIFDKFSVSSINNNKITKNVMPLFVASILLISLSFYSSINGAKEFSSKEKQIEVKTEQKISNYQDSIRDVYRKRIDKIETRNDKLFKANEQLDKEASQLPATWVTNKNKIRSRIDVNLEQVEKNNARIKQLKKERKNRIAEYKNNKIEKANEKKEENSTNSLMFVIISTLIEFIILGGVFFNEYYDIKSYNEFKRKLETDPNFKKWVLYDKMLTTIITDETKVNEKLPTIKSMTEMCKMNNNVVIDKEMNDFLKVLNGLKIIKNSGPAKYVNKTKETAREILKKKFNIE